MAELSRLPSSAQEQIRTGLFGEDERVNDLIPNGEFLKRSILYRDDVWDLGGHPSWKDKAGVQVNLDFSTIPEAWRGVSKDMMLLQLDPSLAPARAPGVPMAETWPQVQEPIKPVTAMGNLKMLRHGLRVIEDQRITAFDSDDWERLTVMLVQPLNVEEKQAGVTLSPATGRARAQQLIALWQVTQVGSVNVLGTRRPFDGREVNELFGPKTRKKTVRPHEDVGNVLGFVAWFFDHVADDVVDHMEWWIENSEAEAPMTRDDLFDAMLQLTSQLAQDNDGVLPGTMSRTGVPTLAGASLGRLLGVHDGGEVGLAARWAKSQLGDTVTYSLTASPCPLPLTSVPSRDGRSLTWIDRLLPTADSLDIWQRRLVYYAMYYIAATVMLRDQQLAELSIDPLHSEEITRPGGSTYVRHYLYAHQTKNRRAPVPTQVTVNARIARIISLLQRMQQLLGYTPRRSSHTGVECLFDQRLATPFGKQVREGNREGLYLDLWFLHLIKDGARELYDRGVIARHLDDVSITMQKVRITCAQAYAVREHGQALAAAFGQWDTARVAAGYVGDIFRLITPLDRDETLDISMKDAGRRLRFASQRREEYTGNGTARLDQAIEHNREVLSNPQPLSAPRLRTLGKKNMNIEQGPLTMCIYHSDSALCGGKGKADFRLCFPGQCRNSVMSRADRARYELMRRQHLTLHADVLRRAADKMDQANPEIKEEFADVADAELHEIVKANLDEYIRAALEDRG